jgi:hypothetical protein
MYLHYRQGDWLAARLCIGEQVVGRLPAHPHRSEVPSRRSCAPAILYAHSYLKKAPKTCERRTAFAATRRKRSRDKAQMELRLTTRTRAPRRHGAAAPNRLQPGRHRDLARGVGSQSRNFQELESNPTHRKRSIGSRSNRNVFECAVFHAQIYGFNVDPDSPLLLTAHRPLREDCNADPSLRCEPFASG